MMLCVEISAKAGMFIFQLDKHLVYGLSQIAPVLVPAQSISRYIYLSALRAPPALTAQPPRADPAPHRAKCISEHGVRRPEHEHTDIAGNTVPATYSNL